MIRTAHVVILIAIAAELIYVLTAATYFFYYLYVIVPAISVLVYSFFLRRLLSVKVRWKSASVVVISLLVLTPFLMGYVSYVGALDSIRQLPRADDKLVFAASYVRSANVFTEQVNGLRYYGNLIGFFGLGMGGCEEMAEIEQGLLMSAGVQTQLLGFVGEDHEILEASVNGTWMASDPGSALYMIGREDYGKMRSAGNNIGGISLAWIIGSNASEFVTEGYVATDNVTIVVSAQGHPYSDGSIVLQHLYNGIVFSTLPIPLEDDGTVTLQIGNMHNFTAPNTDSFYSILVNGVSTGQHVTSYGENLTHVIYVEAPGTASATIQWQILGLAFNLVGAAVMAVGYLVPKKKAIEIGLPRFGGESDEENARLPAVKDRLQQRTFAIVGLALLALGFAIQVLALLQ